MADITSTIGGTLAAVTGSATVTNTALPLTTWRRHPYTVRGYIFFLKPAVVLAARVNQATTTYPVIEIAYDGVTAGSFANVREGMTLVLGTGPGKSDLGRQRIRVAPTGSALYVGRSSRGVVDGTLKVVDNAYITVLDDYRLWAKIPYIAADGTQYKDATTLPIGYPTRPPPKANGGTPVFGIPEDASSTENVIAFSSLNSFAVAPFGPDFGSDNPITPAWQFDDGTPNISLAEEVTVTFDTARRFRWVHLNIADDNSHTHTHHIPVYTGQRDANGQLVQSDEGLLVERFKITDRTVNPDGQTMTVEIHEPISRDEYPEGTLVMYAEEEYFRHTRRADVRLAVKFWGWTSSYSTRQEASERGVSTVTSMTLLDVAGRMKKLPAFPQIIENNLQAGLWTQMAYATIDRYLHYLLHWHSTALDLAEYYPAVPGNLGLYPFSRLGSDGQELWNQVMQRAKAIGCELTCNSRGRLKIAFDPLLLPTKTQFDEMPAIERVYYRPLTPQLTVTTDDYSSATIPVDPESKTHWVHGSAVMTTTLEARYANNKALFSGWPGEAPGQGAVETEVGEQLRRGQTDLNVFLGNYAAVEADPEYPPFDLALTHGADIIEPADKLFIEVEVDNTKFNRPLPFDSRLALPMSVAYTYDHEKGTKKARMTARWEDSGDAGVTIIYNELQVPIYQQPDLGGDDDIVIDDGPETPPEPPPLPDGSLPGRVLVMLESGLILRANTFDEAGLPIFEDVSPSGGQRSSWELHHKLHGDYYRPDRMLIHHKHGISDCADVWATAPLTWNSIYTIPPSFITTDKVWFARGNYWGVQASPNRKDFFFWMDNDPLISSGHDWAFQYTDDNFANVAGVRVDGGYSPPSVQYDGVTQSWWNSGSRGTFWATKNERVYRTEDWGLTWTQADARYANISDSGITDTDLGGGLRKLTFDFTVSDCGLNVDKTAVFYPTLPTGNFFNYVAGVGYVTPMHTQAGLNHRYMALGRKLTQATYIVEVATTCDVVDVSGLGFEGGNVAVIKNNADIAANQSIAIGTGQVNTFSAINTEYLVSDTIGFRINGTTAGGDIEDGEVTITKLEITYQNSAPFVIDSLRSEVDMPFELPTGHTPNRGDARLGFVDFNAIDPRLKIGSAFYDMPHFGSIPYGLVTSKLNAKIMYLLFNELDTSDNLWQSNNAGRTWQARRYPTPAGAATVTGGYHIWDRNPNYLLVFANGDNSATTLAESQDGGVTWNDWSAIITAKLTELGEAYSPIRAVWLDDPDHRWADDWVLSS